jgi:hypothetical protein
MAPFVPTTAVTNLVVSRLRQIEQDGSKLDGNVGIDRVAARDVLRGNHPQLLLRHGETIILIKPIRQDGVNTSLMLCKQSRFVIIIGVLLIVGGRCHCCLLVRALLVGALSHGLQD